MKPGSQSLIAEALAIDANSLPEKLSGIQLPPQMAFPTTDATDKKFNSRLVAPIFGREAAKNREETREGSE